MKFSSVVSLDGHSIWHRLGEGRGSTPLLILKPTIKTETSRPEKSPKSFRVTQFVAAFCVYFPKQVFCGLPSVSGALFRSPLPPQTTPKLDFSRVSRSAHNPSLLRPSVIRVKERLGRLSVQQMEGEIGPRLERSFVRHFLLGNRKSFPAEIPPSSQS